MLGQSAAICFREYFLCGMVIVLLAHQVMADYNGSGGCGGYTESVELAAVGVDTAGAGLNCYHGYLDYAIDMRCVAAAAAAIVLEAAVVTAEAAVEVAVVGLAAAAAAKVLGAAAVTVRHLFE